MQPLPAHAWFRLAVMVAVVFALSYGPVRNQALGMREVRWSKSWQMYGGKGRGLCDVDYWHRTPAGDTPIDRYAALGYDTWWKARSDVRFVYRPEGVIDVAHRLCETLPRPERDVRADARCSAPHGSWETRFAREANLCTTDAIGRRKP